MADRGLDPVTKRDLAEIRELVELRERYYRTHTIQLRATVRQTRSRGATWPAIADALGMTRQGVRHFIRSGS